MTKNAVRYRWILSLGILSLWILLLTGCQPAEETPPEPAPPPPAPAPAPPPPAAEVAILNAKMPLPGVLTGGQPTVEQIEEAAAAGYRTVVNLRTPGEEGSWDEAPKVEELGMRYVSIPVAGTAGLTLENSRQLFELIDDPENQPMMVHCGSGNRIGALFALQAYHVDGKDAESALTIGRDAGLTKLEEAVRGLLESGAEASEGSDESEGSDSGSP